MADQRALQGTRINGRAAFGAAAYAIAVALIFLLGRIGAPDGLVRALGPLTTLAGLGLLGALARSSRIAAFFAADRAGAPLYGGLSLAAAAAGLFLCLAPAQGGAPLGGAGAGIILGALVVGPLARRMGASSLIDAIFARVAITGLRPVFSLTAFVVGALIASAGFGQAVDLAAAFLGGSRGAVGVGLAIVLALCVAPGGLAGLLWSAVASAGAIALVLLLPIGEQLYSGGALAAPIWDGGARLVAALAPAGGAGGVGAAAQALTALAAALGVAVLPPFATGAFVSADTAQASRAGVAGVLLTLVFALALFAGAPLWPAPAGAAASGLRASAAICAALALAAAGVQAASRAIGPGPRARGHGALASQRLALSRGLALLAVVICLALSRQSAFTGPRVLIDAIALSLAFLAPSLALALSGWADGRHAAVALIVSAATIAALIGWKGWAMVEAQALASALAAAAAGFALGWSASLFSRARGENAQRRRVEFFADPPFDVGL